MQHSRIWLIIVFLVFCGSSYAVSDDFRRRLHQIDSVADESFQKEKHIRAEIRFGRDVAARILGRFHLFQSEELSKYVSLVGKGLSLYGNRPELQFHFAILDDPAVNAYSTPGGYVFITLGALELIEDESELAAILAHEIAHVTNRHIVKEVNIKAQESSLVSGISSIVGGSSDTAKVAFFQAVDKAVSILFENGFAKKDELDADTTGTLLLANAGYDPSALLRVLNRIDKTSARDEQKKNMTHPPTQERLSTLQDLIEQQELVSLNLKKAKQRFKNNVQHKN